MSGVPIQPHCLIVTGLPGSGKTLWLKRWLGNMAVNTPSARCSVLLAEEGNTVLDPTAQAAGHEVRHCPVPVCLCCMDFGMLTDSVRETVASGSVDWLALEIPFLLIGGFLTAFDRDLGWSRQVVVCRKLKTENNGVGSLKEFFFNVLCEQAVAVIHDEVSAGTALASVQVGLSKGRQDLRSAHWLI